MGVAASIVAAGTVGAAALSSNAQKNAQKDALAAQQAASVAAQARLAPYQQTGTDALDRLDYFAGGNEPGVQSGPDYEAYANSNDDVLAGFQNLSDKDRAFLASQGYGGTLEAYGQYHYDRYGQGEGRDLPEFSVEDQSSGLSREEGLMDLIEASPGYQARYDAMSEAVNQSNTAGGLGISGKNVMDEATVAGSLVNDEYNRLVGINSNLAGIGYNAAGTAASIDVNSGNQEAAGLYNLGQIEAGALERSIGAIAGLGETVVNDGLLDGLYGVNSDEGVVAAAGAGANNVGSSDDDILAQILGAVS